MLKGDYEPAMQISLFQKDLQLAMALGDSLNQPLPLAATANKVRYLPPTGSQWWGNTQSVFPTGSYHQYWFPQAAPPLITYIESASQEKL